MTNSTPPSNSAKRPEVLEGHVASILNERELVINIGSKAGVRSGKIFKVLAEAVITVRDPITNEVIGSVDREKVRVKAIDVQERMTICKTFEYRVYGGLGFAAQAALMMAPERKEYDTFQASTQSYPTPLSQEESIVKIGDRVREVKDID